MNLAGLYELIIPAKPAQYALDGRPWRRPRLAKKLAILILFQLL